MVVQHNVTAMNANRQLGITTGAQAKSTEKLSSGYKVNRAADDAAGLAISEKMRSQIRGLGKASDNAQTGISAVQTAEGALNEVHSILQRVNELATQAANDINTTTDRAALALEIGQLGSEVTRIGNNTTFNNQKLLDGSFKEKKLQVGAQAGNEGTIEINIDDISEFGSSISALSISTNASAQNAMSSAQSMIDSLSTTRATLGSIQNRLEHTVANLDTTQENTQSAESLIRDTDMAEQMVDFSKNSILAQAGQSMLAQANQLPQSVLSLLQ